VREIAARRATREIGNGRRRASRRIEKEGGDGCGENREPDCAWRRRPAHSGSVAGRRNQNATARTLARKPNRRRGAGVDEPLSPSARKTLAREKTPDRRNLARGGAGTWHGAATLLRETRKPRTKSREPPGGAVLLENEERSGTQAVAA
jgi:hypothetical protein